MFTFTAPLAILSVFALLSVAGAVDTPLNVITAERVFHTVIAQSPYLVDRTTTIVWTQSSSIVDTETSTPTQTASA
ncbi:hypothetical protein FPV67DRAFT_1664453 [Lyophyllum atratum]|nr:hypothetical protein FPV67DRAFT_1664453 [Lyophyllum atratum]